MPHRIFNLEEVAEYLHLNRSDVETLLKNGEIPSERRGDRVQFRRRDIDAWASQRILGLQERRLEEYHRRSSRATEDFASRLMMPEMIQIEGIDPRLPAKTRSSVLREMALLAEKTGFVPNRVDLVASLEEREQLCSTGLPGGFAIMHTRHHQPYMFDASFIVLGRTVQQIPFGAPDGSPTDLFFLLCCQDDRLHLHALARLCVMAQKTSVLAELRDAPDAAAMHAVLLAAEEQAVAKS